MSEREDIFFTKAEKALDALEKTKAWYKNAVVSLCVTILVCASGAGVFGYRLGKLDSELDEFATKKSVELYRENTETMLDAFVCLTADKYKEAYEGFNARFKVMNSNIFQFTTERGGRNEE